MPAIAKTGTILVTAASGFIPIHTVKEALNRGLTVVGTVRSSAKGDYVKKVVNNDRFSYTIVEDISKPNAFDEAVQVAKFDGVLHMASPFHAKATKSSEIYEPAIKGTQSILESVAKHAPSVKRVIVTSSFAAIMKMSVKPPYAYSEEDYNTETAPKVEEMEKSGETEGIGALIYTASKALAEQKAWQFLKDNKVSFDLATVNPVYVFGPAIQDVPNAEALNTSNNVIYQLMLGNLKNEDLPGYAGAYVHVTDVAEAHVEALLREEAGGQRYLLADRPFTKQEIAEILTKIDSSIKLPAGDKAAADEAISKEKVAQMNHSKAEKELGIKFRDLETCVKDVYDSLKQKEKEWSS